MLTLLRYGVKNAIAAEGTDVPDAVGSLTEERTVTAFLDGDRGGELVLKELAQVGEVDYVAFAPEDRSVEDLDRRTAMAALREKVPYHSVADLETPSDLATDAGAVDGTGAAAVDVVAGDEPGAEPAADGSDANGTDVPDAVGDETTATPETLPGHVRAVVEGETNSARLLDAEFRSVAEGDAEEAFDLVADAAEPPAAVVLDGEVDQRLLDVAAQRGVEQVVAASTGEFVKRPTSVRVRTAEQLLAANEA